MENNDSILNDLNEQPKECNYAQKVLYGFTDTLIYLLVGFLLLKYLPEEGKVVLFGSNRRFITLIAFIVLYRFVCILIFNKTIGMLIFKIRYLNEQYLPLSLSEKLAAIFYLNPSIKIYKDQ